MTRRTEPPRETPADPDDAHRTRVHAGSKAPLPPSVRRFRLTVAEGPETGRTWESTGDRCSIGSHESNDLVLSDDTVSRFHCEVRIASDGARVRDLGSRNGTVLDGVPVVEAFARGDSLIRLGSSVVRFQFATDRNPLPVSEATRFGSLVGVSSAMRAAFALLERASSSNATVLLEGETGTGKGQAAESIHKASARRDKPFLTLDCSAIPQNLLESELFGHERGAFTSATSQRIGIFEAANGGTVFLDEIGELGLDLQPKLLRVLENREVRRVGSNMARSVDVRVVAATNRDLRAEVNAGRFRSDLYFRLAVLKIPLPALRQRPEDIPTLVDGILTSLGADDEESKHLRTPEFYEQLARASWPGNVRELRNCIERCLVFQDARLVDEEVGAAEADEPRVDARKPFAAARDEALAQFERSYLEALLRMHGGKMSRAAAAAGIGRVYLYKLLQRHDLKK
jgi:DNA-binding NtrC family response regulator